MQCIEPVRRVYRVGLLGTRYTMEPDFYKDKLVEKGMYVVVPDRYERELLHHIIYKELCNGIVTSYAKRLVLNIIKKLTLAHELNAIILGCPQLPLLITKSDLTIPLFDSLEIHMDAFYSQNQEQTINFCGSMSPINIQK